ncbi:hypothetical protein DFQ28_000789 [Apophysomyces sp. BC1034]|nr:hypothetical protein DFQ29_008515 [Apophysomyces sp. BC1021]KAG0191186.1 hypothetical protein DFQ28_000789 [Apophysomyces sp. BC1034]
MGNTFSHTTSTSSKSSSTSDYRDIRSFSLGNRYHIPKHLRPIKPSRKLQKKLEQERTNQKKPKHKSVPPQESNGELDRIFGRKKKNKSTDDDNEEDEHYGDQSGAFRWHKGRRFINIEGVRYPLPTDQSNLDRLRVEYYLCRWAFRGNVLAPVENQLRQGIKVLNNKYIVYSWIMDFPLTGLDLYFPAYSCGPGLWLGHPIIDLALDFRRSDFTAVDLCDLLPMEQLQCINECLATQQPEEPTSSSPSLTNTPEEPPTHSINPQLASVISRCPDFTTMHPALSGITSQTQSTLFPPPNQSIQPTASISTSTHMFNIDLESDEEDDLSERETQSCPSTIVPKTRRKKKPKRTKAVLNNLRFHELNVVQDNLPFKDNTFDYVQQSLMTLVYSGSDWDRVLSEIVRVTKPGGYIQLTEVDMFIHQAGPKGTLWQEDEACREKRGTDLRMACRLRELLNTAGLEDVEERFVSIPIGCWGLDIGVLWKENFEEFVSAAQPFLANNLSVSASVSKQRWRETAEELKTTKTFSNVHVAWARKPAAEATAPQESCPFLLE